MRRMLAALLLLILSVSLPFGAGSLRFCLLENRILLTEVEPCPTAAKKCCSKCKADRSHGQDKPCCVELKKLPDSNLPSAPDRVPAYDAVALPQQVFAPLIVSCEAKESSREWPVELSALPPPSLRRALLGVWTI